MAYSLSYFNLLQSNIAQFHISFRKCFFFFKAIYLSPNSMSQVENVGMNLHQYQINKELKPIQGLIYVRWIFSELIFDAAYIRTFEFSNVNIEKRISERVRSYCSYRLRLSHSLRPNAYIEFIPHWIKLR